MICHHRMAGRLGTWDVCERLLKREIFASPLSDEPNGLWNCHHNCRTMSCATTEYAKKFQPWFNSKESRQGQSKAGSTERLKTVMGSVVRNIFEQIKSTSECHRQNCCYG